MYFVAVIAMIAWFATHARYVPVHCQIRPHKIDQSIEFDGVQHVASNSYRNSQIGKMYVHQILLRACACAFVAVRARSLETCEPPVVTEFVYRVRDVRLKQCCSWYGVVTQHSAFALLHACA
jgi:hypothetical protein